jgi:rhodanese-related sulfurtransferase
MQHISAAELKAWLDDKARDRPVLIDVREPWEFDLCQIPGAVLMPLQGIPGRVAELDEAADTVLICHHGARSMQAAMFLQQQGFTKLHNLTGGVAAWAQQVDPAMPRY